MSWNPCDSFIICLTFVVLILNEFVNLILIHQKNSKKQNIKAPDNKVLSNEIFKIASIDSFRSLIEKTKGNIQSIVNQPAK